MCLPYMNRAITPTVEEGGGVRGAKGGVRGGLGMGKGFWER